MRHNEGKLQWALIDFKQLEGMVRVLEFGARKYGKRMPTTDVNLFQLCHKEHVSSVLEKNAWSQSRFASRATSEPDIPRLTVQDVDVLESLRAKACVHHATRLSEHSHLLSGPRLVNAISRITDSARVSLKESTLVNRSDVNDQSTSLSKNAENFYADLVSTELQRSSICVSAKTAAHYVKAGLTCTLITTIPLASTEVFFVASATRRSDCFKMTIDFLSGLSLISSDIRETEGELVVPAADNWKKGLPMRQQCESMMQHLVAIMSGEVKDKETGEYHWHSIMCNAMFMGHTYEHHPQLIDIPVPKIDDAELENMRKNGIIIADHIKHEQSK